jgi:uncharacterized protein
MAEAGPVRVVVVHCPRGAQHVREIAVAPDTTIREAIRLSGLVGAFDRDLPDGLDIAVHGHARGLDDRVRDGDRIELLRGLSVDPKDARRVRAAVRQRRAVGP